MAHMRHSEQIQWLGACLGMYTHWLGQSVRRTMSAHVVDIPLSPCGNIDCFVDRFAPAIVHVYSFVVMGLLEAVFVLDAIHAGEPFLPIIRFPRLERLFNNEGLWVRGAPRSSTSTTVQPKHIKETLLLQFQLLGNLPPYPQSRISIPAMRHRVLLPDTVEVPTTAFASCIISALGLWIRPTFRRSSYVHHTHTALLRVDTKEPSGQSQDVG